LAEVIPDSLKAVMASAAAATEPVTWAGSGGRSHTLRVATGPLSE